jgi:DNA repair exonuclease SbcCD ATPase subunit
MEDKNLKLIGLQINGVRKLTAVSMEFNGSGLIPLVGQNCQGKTTVLDSLSLLLTGAKSTPKDIIQHGKDRAEIIAKIGDFQIKRVITKKGTRLEVKTSEGVKPKPQEFLDTLRNELTFDPRPFLNKSPENKLRFMMDLLKLDFSVHDSGIAMLEQERLLVGREVKAIGDIPEVEKTDTVDASELNKELDDIEKKNKTLVDAATIEREEEIKTVYEFNQEQVLRRNALNAINEAVSKADKTVVSIRKKIKDLNDDLKHAQGHQLRLIDDQLSTIIPEPEMEIPDTVEPVLASTQSLKEQIYNISSINLKAMAYSNYMEKVEAKKAKEDSYKSLSVDIKKEHDLKKKLLAETDMPIEGLEIRDDGIFYKGIFSENWSESEGLRISSELCVAMNPKLRAIFIDKGESYDKKSLEALGKWAVENNLQAFITIVDEIPEVLKEDVFYIEDGQVLTVEKDDGSSQEPDDEGLDPGSSFDDWMDGVA